MISKRESISLIGAAISFILFFFLLDINLEFVTNLQINFLTSFLTDNIFILFKMTMALSLFTLGLAFLSSAGFYESNYKLGFISLIVLPFIILRFTLMQIFLLAAVLLASIYVIPMANTYGKELKSWKYFRVGSNAVSKGLFLFNIIIAVGIFIVVSLNMNFYQNSFKESFVNFISASFAVPGQYEQTFKTQLEQNIENMPFYQAYIRWFPLITAATVWFVLEILRQFLSLLAGIASSILIRVYRTSPRKG